MILSADVSSLLLLARLSEISRYSRSYGGMQQYIIIFAALALLLVVCGLFFVLNQLSKRREKHASTEKTVPLIKQLTDEWGLTAAERQLLNRVTSRNAIQPPEVMFVDPGLWGPCLETCPHDRKELIALMEKLFGHETREQFVPTETAP